MTKRTLFVAATMMLSGVSALGCSAQAHVEVKAPEVAKPAPAPEAPKPVYITISDRIQFASGKSTLLAPSLQVLDEVAAVLKDNDQIRRIEIEGHTDGSGVPQHNLKLSQKRAEAVRDYLVNTHGIDGARLVARGYGQDKPVADNTTREGREENRRVEFRITDQGVAKLASK
jgi:outer membrane protein OmpA-like peptidoglycan-associated protein